MGTSLSLQNHACHLKQRGNVYYFRITIPRGLRHIFGKRELKYRLGRIPLGEARILSNLAASTVKLYFKRIRENRMSHMTEKQIATLIDEEVCELLVLDSRKRVSEKKGVADTLSIPDIDEQDYGLRGFEWHYSHDDKDIERIQNECSWEEIKDSARDIIEKRGLDISENDWQFKHLCFELCSAMLKFNYISQCRNLGDFAIDFEQFPRLADNYVPDIYKNKVDSGNTQVNNEYYSSDTCFTESEANKSIYKLSKLISEYLDEIKETIKPRTFKEYEASLSLLQRVLGDIPLSDLDRLKIKEYKDTLRKLPPHMNKREKYKDKAIDELINIAEEKLSDSSINQQLTRASQCFKWGVQNGLLQSNPAENVTIGNSSKPQEQRKEFEIEDLKAIFHSDEYIKDTFTYSYQFWVPIVALFTGMRIEEICQLHLEDINKVNNVYVFDLFNKDDRERKTQAGQRYVPIHSFLSDVLQLPMRVTHLFNNGNNKLFPDIKQGTNGLYGHYPSKWFNERYKKRKCGIDDKKKVFHSFRHTVTNHLKQKGVNDNMLAELIGHELPGETLGRYGKKYQPEVLYENVVQHVDFEGLGLDLSHLKRSKYVQNTDI